mmetsp:Transcript_125102/g.286643  ORF Transcript_125102/g.286643 Transcript_125102/m.286643 type:complete len:173 (-) Transcript_125102:117-635(-)
MNGMSFDEFERASFDDLHNRGFAGMKDAQRMAKDMPKMLDGAKDFAKGLPDTFKGGDFGKNFQGFLDDGRGRSNMARMENAPHGGGAPHRRVSASSAGSAAEAPVALNDYGAMPGNARVQHSTDNWKPSKQADQQARASFRPTPQRSTPGTPAPRALPASSGKNDYVAWKSN